jgi:hypothetical protein
MKGWTLCSPVSSRFNSVTLKIAQLGKHAKDGLKGATRRVEVEDTEGEVGGKRSAGEAKEVVTESHALCSGGCRFQVLGDGSRSGRDCSNPVTPVPAVPPNKQKGSIRLHMGCRAWAVEVVNSLCCSHISHAATDSCW